MNVYDAIRTKRAVRLFQSKPIEHDLILKILDAGRRAQSSKNTQPWQFVVIQNKDTLKALSETGTYAAHLANASFAVALLGDLHHWWNGFDLGQAAAYLQLAAWELGVASCIAAIYDQDKAKALLGVPSDLNFWAAISFGYPAPNFVPARMGGRKPLEEVVHWEKY